MALDAPLEAGSSRALCGSTAFILRSGLASPSFLLNRVLSLLESEVNH